MSSISDTPSRFISLSASSEFEDDEGALEALVSLKNLEFGELFTDRETELDEKEGEGLSIGFFDEDGFNALHLSADSDSNLQISLSLDEDSVEDVGAVLTKIRETVGELEIKGISTYRRLDVPFDSLSIPVVEDPDIPVSGIKLSPDGVEFIIQESDSGIAVNAVWDLEDDETDSLDSIGVHYTEELDNFVERLY